jgi:hypothetical protein
MIFDPIEKMEREELERDMAVPVELRRSNLYTELRWRRIWRDIKETLIVSAVCIAFWAFIFWMWPN